MSMLKNATFAFLLGTSSISAASINDYLIQKHKVQEGTVAVAVCKTDCPVYGMVALQGPDGDVQRLGLLYRKPTSQEADDIFGRGKAPSNGIKYGPANGPLGCGYNVEMSEPCAPAQVDWANSVLK